MGWFTVIAPILIAAPGYFGGELSFGALMMTVGAFIQVQQALRWFIDNFSTIADWRATLLRITSFREAIVAVETLGVSESRIELTESTSRKLVFDNLEIATPTGCTMLNERHVEIAQGDRVLIVGEHGIGKTILFRVIAGLWLWGAGRLALPASDGIMFMPRQPYLPLGTLRAGLAYPSPETSYRDEEIVNALQHTGLSRLAPSIDHIARWDRELTYEEQQSLVFTRILLHKPQWVVVDDALDTLDDEARKRIINLFEDELKDTALINIGRNDTKNSFFKRVLHLIKEPCGRCFIPNLTMTGFSPTIGGARHKGQTR
jgi:putative ATP-binding cassette transporter